MKNNINKNIAKEKLSLGIWVTKIKTDAVGARLKNT